MALFPQSALNDGVRKREVFGWAMYDFANSGYTTVVLTAVFNAYFVSVVAGNAAWGTFAWTCALAFSSAVVMLTVPTLGAQADRRAMKKRLLLVTTAGCVVATAALAWAGPGDVAWAVVAVVLSNICYAYGEFLIAAFLPELARGGSMGRVSGWGWSFGYCGGMLTLGLSLAYVLIGKANGIPATQTVPVSMLITASVYALASTVTFVLLRERAVPQPPRPGDEAGVAASIRRLRRSWRDAMRYEDFRWLLACSVAYQAGIAVVIAVAAVYAQQVIGFEQTQTMLLIFLVNIASAAGAFGWGYVQDRIGQRRALSIALIGWMVMTVMVAAGTATPTGRVLFWVAAVIAGLCMGASQSGGRALAGLFAPAPRRAEFFGLWTVATRFAAVIGPLTYGLVTLLSGNNHRLAIVFTGGYFVAGWLLLRRIDVARGSERAVGVTCGDPA